MSTPQTSPATDPAPADDGKPPKSGAILTVLILGAIVANINLGISNVALPAIGTAFGATQGELNVVGVAFTLGLAASVLYLGALADHYGRKHAMLLGAALSIPTAMAAAWAPSIEVLIGARFFGGVAAGMLYPTTLSLVTALFRGPARTKAIATWSGIGGGVATIGGVIGGFLLEHAWWGSVFLPTVPVALAVVILGIVVIPAHAGETTDRVDHAGGILSVVFIGPLVLGISLVPDFGFGTPVLVLFGIAVVGLVGFVVRELRASNPLFDLAVLKVRTFTISLFGGTIIWGGLIGAMFIAQQFMQNVLGYQTLPAAAISVPASVGLVLAARPAAVLINRFGGRMPFALGLALTTAGFATIAVTFRDGVNPWVVCGAYLLLGVGIGFAGPPSSGALMGSVPVRRAGMGSAANDLQRDFGGAFFQAVMGSLLAVQYSRYFAKAFAGLDPQQAAAFTQQATRQISSSFTSAEQVAKSFPPQYADGIVSAAKIAFTEGKTAALVFATAAAAIGFVVVVIWFPRKDAEAATYAAVAAASDAASDDGAAAGDAGASGAGPAAAGSGDTPASGRPDA